MDFDLTEQQKQIQTLVRDFAKKELEPIVLKCDEEERFPIETYKKLGALGLLGVNIPVSAGGPGLDNVSCAIEMEEMGYYAVDFASAVLASSLCGFVISSFGNEEQKRKYLPPVIKGDSFLGVAVTEPQGGSDVSTMTTKITKKGGKYVINGEKSWIGAAAAADCFITVGRMAGNTEKPVYTSLLVDRKTKGFSSERYTNKLGHRVAAVGGLSFNDCEVPAENLLGKEGDGLRAALASLELGRLYVSARCCGALRACYDESVKYAQERVVFGSPIGKYQLIQAKIAEMAINLKCAWLLVYHLAWLKDKGVARVKKDASITKKFVTDALFKAATEAVQIQGAYGCTNDNRMAKIFRDAKVQQIVEGTNEIHTILIAETSLGYRKG